MPFPPSTLLTNQQPVSQLERAARHRIGSIESTSLHPEQCRVLCNLGPRDGGQAPTQCSQKCQSHKRLATCQPVEWQVGSHEFIVLPFHQTSQGERFPVDSFFSGFTLNFGSRRVAHCTNLFVFGNDEPMACQCQSTEQQCGGLHGRRNRFRYVLKDAQTHFWTRTRVSFKNNNFSVCFESPSSFATLPTG